jgi:hypothetical protein
MSKQLAESWCEMQANRIALHHLNSRNENWRQGDPEGYTLQRTKSNEAEHAEEKHTRRIAVP